MGRSALSREWACPGLGQPCVHVVSASGGHTLRLAAGPARPDLCTLGGRPSLRLPGIRVSLCRVSLLSLFSVNVAIYSPSALVPVANVAVPCMWCRWICERPSSPAFMHCYSRVPGDFCCEPQVWSFWMSCFS